MKQYFILGRNPELSRQEILSYLEARNQKFKEIFFESNNLLIDLEKEININELGGTIKSGVILKNGDESFVEGYLFDEEIVKEKKFTYAILGNMEPDVLKLKFKSEKKKAVLKHGRRRIEFQNKEKANLAKADYFFILHKFEKEVYFGVINQNYDSKSVEFRDMNKPVRREHLAISPRLAKILINLSGAKKGEWVLDCFCGIAGILQEAVLKNINAYGIDNDSMAIYNARKNLTWLRANYQFESRYNVEKGDARRVMNHNFDAVATETPLGKVFRKKPGNNESKKMIHDFENFIIPILRHLRDIKKKDAKIAITFPRVRTFGVNLDEIQEKTDLKLVIPSIIEEREKQFISREIVVFI